MPTTSELSLKHGLARAELKSWLRNNARFAGYVEVRKIGHFATMEENFDLSGCQLLFDFYVKSRQTLRVGAHQIVSMVRQGMTTNSVAKKLNLTPLEVQRILINRSHQTGETR